LKLIMFHSKKNLIQTPDLNVSWDHERLLVDVNLNEDCPQILFKKNKVLKLM